MKQKHRSYPRREIGISLIELIIVMALLAIVAVSAVPGMHRIHSEWALWGGARMLESSLLAARNHAITANDSLIINIEKSGACFYWDTPDGYRYEYSHRCLPTGVKIVQSPNKSVRFYEHGNVVPAGAYVLEGSTGKYSVIINRMGRIRIQRH